MSKLPQISGREVAKALEKTGYLFDPQKGSHIILRQQSPPHRRLTIPDHKIIAKGTLRAMKEPPIEIEGSHVYLKIR